MATQAANAKKRKSGKAGDASVTVRVKRAENAQAREIAKAFGIEGVTNAADLKEKMSNVTAEREKNMTDSERNASKVTQLQEQLKQTQGKLDQYKRAYADVKGKYDTVKDDYETLEAEVIVKDAAQEAGVANFDYAMHLFRSHCVKEGENAQFGEDPKGFFEDLKKNSRELHIFQTSTVAAGPQSAQEKAEADSQPGNAGTQTQSDLPPQPDPKPKEAGGTQPPPGGNSGGDLEDVTDMDKGAFQQRTEEKYGYRPSR